LVPAGPGPLCPSLDMADQEIDLILIEPEKRRLPRVGWTMSAVTDSNPGIFVSALIKIFTSAQFPILHSMQFLRHIRLDIGFGN